MKVNPNSPLTDWKHSVGVVVSNVPIRLDIATKILAGLVVPCTPGHQNTNDNVEAAYKVGMALQLADVLIAMYNETIPKVEVADE